MPLEVFRKAEGIRPNAQSVLQKKALQLELKLAKGNAAIAVIKASDVMVGVD